jgi:hypothetical protein
LDELEVEDSEATGSGGAISAYGFSTLEITDSQFNITKAGTSGGAIYAYTSYGGTITLSGLESEDSEAGGYGGAIYAQGFTDLEISNSQFTITKANHGGAINTIGGIINMSGLEIENSEATGAGGAIHASNFSSLEITNSRFKDTKAGNYSGAIYTSAASGGTITLNGVDIENAEANTWGAVYSYQGSLSITGSTFTRCTGDYYIYSQGPLSLDNTTFTFAPVHVGAIIAWKGFRLDNVTFANYNAQPYLLSLSGNYLYQVVLNCHYNGTLLNTPAAVAGLSSLGLIQLSGGAMITTSP